MEKLIILFLTLLVTPLYGLDKAADKLDLTLPETPFDYEQMNKDSLLIQEAINKLNKVLTINGDSEIEVVFEPDFNLTEH